MVDNRSSSTHVIVACKVHVPWIDFQYCEAREVSENTQTGPRTIKEYSKTGPILRIRGTSYPVGVTPEEFPVRPDMSHGYALTKGIRRDLWEKIAEQHAKAPYFQSGMIFALEKVEDIAAKAKEFRGVTSGLEPILRDKTGLIDARVSKPVMRGVSALTTAERI